MLVNGRDEWDLPGGRPERGEDHRAALEREVLEETGLAVQAGDLVDEHVFEVLPRRFVRIIAYACVLCGSDDVTLSDEHHAAHWLPVADLHEGVFAGHVLPAGYLRAIRLAAIRSGAARSSS